jgi:hypothetical protein
LSICLSARQTSDSAIIKISIPNSGRSNAEATR